VQLTSEIVMYKRASGEAGAVRARIKHTMDVLFGPILAIHASEHAPRRILLGTVLQVRLLPVGDRLEFRAVGLGLGCLHQVQVAVEVVLERLENMRLQAPTSALSPTNARPPLATRSPTPLRTPSPPSFPIPSPVPQSPPAVVSRGSWARSRPWPPRGSRRPTAGS